MSIEAGPVEVPSVPLYAGDADARLRVDALNERAYALRLTDARAGLEIAGEALALARGAGYRRGEGHALLALGTCRALLFDLDSALADLHAAVAAFEEVGDDRGRAVALARIGNAHWRRGDYPAALPWHLSALALHRAIGNRDGEADTLNSLGNVHHSIGEYDRALEAYHASLVIYEEEGDRFGIAYVLNNLGNIHGRLREYAEALRHHERALELKRELGDRSGEAIACANLATSYAGLDEHARALELYATALGLARAVGERTCEAEVLGSIGDVHRRLGEPAAALEHYRVSLEVSRAHGLRYYEVEALLRLGGLLTETGRVDEALEHLRRAAALMEGVGARQQVYEVHLALSAACEAAGDAAAALRHHKRFHHAREEVWGTESDRRIQGVMVRAEVERSEREAELLREKNEELTAANDEKARLLEQLRLQAAELERLSREDALTGFSNRRHLDEQLTQEWERARRFGRDLTVAMVDIDHFKQVNDRFTHAVGDEVLRAVARLLRAGTRGIDVVARYGGEEFVLVLVETSAAEARGICERLRETVEGRDWSAIRPGLAVTISIGLAADLSLDSPGAMVAAADARLYEAKRAGRNRVCG